MKTYADVAATALREFAESNGVYVRTEAAVGALDAITDALVEAGAHEGTLREFFASEANEPDVWDEPTPDTAPADVAAALRVLAQALGVPLS